MEGSSVEALGCALKALAARTLISTGVLYLVDLDGLTHPMDQLKVAAMVSAASLASQKYVEPMVYGLGKPYNLTPPV